MVLNKKQQELCRANKTDFSDLGALFLNCTLKRPGGPENDFTNRNTTFMTWNLLHMARMLKDAGGIPAHGNQRSQWDAGRRFDFPNPEHR